MIFDVGHMIVGTKEPRHRAVKCTICHKQIPADEDSIWLGTVKTTRYQLHPSCAGQLLITFIQVFSLCLDRKEANGPRRRFYERYLAQGAVKKGVQSGELLDYLKKEADDG